MKGGAVVPPFYFRVLEAETAKMLSHFAKSAAAERKAR